MLAAREIKDDLHILFIGAPGVGKYHLVYQLIVQHYIKGSYDPTEPEWCHSIPQNCDGQVNNIWAVRSEQPNWDQARKEMFCCQVCEAFVLVYDICDCESFDEVKVLWKDLMMLRWEKNGEGCRTPICLAGNKVDREVDRVVSYEEGKELARRLGAGFKEITAKNHEGVEEVAVGLLREVRRVRQGREPEIVGRREAGELSEQEMRQKSEARRSEKPPRWEISRGHWKAG